MCESHISRPWLFQAFLVDQDLLVMMQSDSNIFPALFRYDSERCV